MNHSFDLLTQISSSRQLFSHAEETLANYVLEDPKRVLNQSITEFAENCGVSVSTVSRFCRHIYINGYQEFRLELMRSLTNRASSETDTTSEIAENDSIQSVVAKVSTVYEQSISRAASGIDIEVFSRVCDMIDAASDVYFVGIGNMFPIALAAKLQFMEVSRKFHCDIDSATQALATCLMDSSCLVILITCSGNAIDTVDVARFAKSKGAKIVAISRYTQSKLAEYCDEILLCGVCKSKQQFSSLPLSMGFQFITDLLYTEYCRRHIEICTKNKSNTCGFVIGKQLTNDNTKKNTACNELHCKK